jgi:transcriptional regulator with XRE-family HTH domain
MLKGVLAPGATIRDRRRGNGLTQAQLALRAGTTQAAVSRLERGELSPTFETFARLLAAMGESFDVQIRREEGDFDREHLRDLLARSPAERLELAMSWNRLAGEVALAGRRARELSE